MVKKLKKEYDSLASFVINTREKLNLTQEELAKNSSLSIDEIQQIEQGMELFLPTTIRQKLAKGLRVDNREVKQYEYKEDFNLAKKHTMDEIRELILLNSSNVNFSISCPVCGEKFKTKSKMFKMPISINRLVKTSC